jgi:hypothetical protein
VQATQRWQLCYFNSDDIHEWYRIDLHKDQRLTFSFFFVRQFDVAFEGVCSLRDIELAVKPLSDKEIKDNMGDLKKKLKVNFNSISYATMQNLHKNTFNL